MERPEGWSRRQRSLMKQCLASYLGRDPGIPFLSFRCPCSDLTVRFPISPFLTALQLCSCQQKARQTGTQAWQGWLCNQHKWSHSSTEVSPSPSFLQAHQGDTQSTGTAHIMGTSMLMTCLLLKVCTSRAISSNTPSSDLLQIISVPSETNFFSEQGWRHSWDDPSNMATISAQACV